jgi:hypothetical protein
MNWNCRQSHPCPSFHPSSPHHPIITPFSNILQKLELPLEAPDYDPDEERFMLSGLLGMVEEEVADLRSWLEFGEPKLLQATKQKEVNDYERLHCELALAC